jgi:hypothetical protein
MTKPLPRHRPKLAAPPRPPETILEATETMFAHWFRDRTTWAPWFSFLCALFGLPMTEAQQATYRECTGRTEPPAAPADEAWLICGAA